MKSIDRMSSGGYIYWHEGNFMSRKDFFNPRILAILLSLSLTLPNPALALRQEGVDAQPTRAGLEDALTNGQPNPAAGMEEKTIQEVINVLEAAAISYRYEMGTNRVSEKPKQVNFKMLAPTTNQGFSSKLDSGYYAVPYSWSVHFSDTFASSRSQLELEVKKVAGSRDTVRIRRIEDQYEVSSPAGLEEAVTQFRTRIHAAKTWDELVALDEEVRKANKTLLSAVQKADLIRLLDERAQIFRPTPGAIQRDVVSQFRARIHAAKSWDELKALETEVIQTYGKLDGHQKANLLNLIDERIAVIRPMPGISAAGMEEGRFPTYVRQLTKQVNAGGIFRLELDENTFVRRVTSSTGEILYDSGESLGLGSLIPLTSGQMNPLWLLAYDSDSGLLLLDPNDGRFLNFPPLGNPIEIRARFAATFEDDQKSLLLEAIGAAGGISSFRIEPREASHKTRVGTQPGVVEMKMAADKGWIRVVISDQGDWIVSKTAGLEEVAWGNVARIDEVAAPIVRAARKTRNQALLNAVVPNLVHLYGGLNDQGELTNLTTNLRAALKGMLVTLAVNDLTGRLSWDPSQTRPLPANLAAVMEATLKLYNQSITSAGMEEKKLSEKMDICREAAEAGDVMALEQIIPDQHHEFLAILALAAFPGPYSWNNPNAVGHLARRLAEVFDVKRNARSIFPTIEVDSLPSAEQLGHAIGTVIRTFTGRDRAIPEGWSDEVLSSKRQNIAIKINVAMVGAAVLATALDMTAPAQGILTAPEPFERKELLSAADNLSSLIRDIRTQGYYDPPVSGEWSSNFLGKFVRPASAGMEEARVVLGDSLSRRDLFEAIKTLAETGVDSGNLAGYFEGLQPMFQEAGYKGELWTPSLSDLPAAPETFGKSIYVDERVPDRDKLITTLEKAGITILKKPGEAKEAAIVIGIESTRITAKQALLQVNENTVGSVTPALLKYLEDKGLLNPGAVVVLHLRFKRSGDLVDSFLLFA
ncbi:MAG: hypothetical protein HY211_06415 [Candidatus Omnitrophica bacterium]|nr:hypothetical protein [Candidatus Omnitrophota bacterium]